eukprot:RCo025233
MHRPWLQFWRAWPRLGPLARRFESSMVGSSRQARLELQGRFKAFPRAAPKNLKMVQSELELFLGDSWNSVLEVDKKHWHDLAAADQQDASCSSSSCSSASSSSLSHRGEGVQRPGLVVAPHGRGPFAGQGRQYATAITAERPPAKAFRVFREAALLDTAWQNIPFWKLESLLEICWIRLPETDKKMWMKIADEQTQPDAKLGQPERERLLRDCILLPVMGRNYLSAAEQPRPPAKAFQAFREAARLEPLWRNIPFRKFERLLEICWTGLPETDKKMWMKLAYEQAQPEHAKVGQPEREDLRRDSSTSHPEMDQKQRHGVMETEQRSTMNQVFIPRFHPDVSREQLLEYFQQFGVVAKCSVPLNQTTGRPRGFAVVTFATEGAVDSVVSRPHKICGQNIPVKRALLRKWPSLRPTRSGDGTLGSGVPTNSVCSPDAPQASTASIPHLSPRCTAPASWDASGSYSCSSVPSHSPASSSSLGHRGEGMRRLGLAAAMPGPGPFARQSRQYASTINAERPPTNAFQAFREAALLEPSWKLISCTKLESMLVTSWNSLPEADKILWINFGEEQAAKRQAEKPQTVKRQGASSSKNAIYDPVQFPSDYRDRDNTIAAQPRSSSSVGPRGPSKTTAVGAGESLQDSHQGSWATSAARESPNRALGMSPDSHRASESAVQSLSDCRVKRSAIAEQPRTSSSSSTLSGLSKAPATSDPRRSTRDLPDHSRSQRSTCGSGGARELNARVTEAMVNYQEDDSSASQASPGGHRAAGSILDCDNTPRSCRPQERCSFLERAPTMRSQSTAPASGSRDGPGGVSRNQQPGQQMFSQQMSFVRSKVQQIYAGHWRSPDASLAEPKEAEPVSRGKADSGLEQSLESRHKEAAQQQSPPKSSLAGMYSLLSGGTKGQLPNEAPPNSATPYTPRAGVAPKPSEHLRDWDPAAGARGNQWPGWEASRPKPVVRQSSPGRTAHEREPSPALSPGSTTVACGTADQVLLDLNMAHKAQSGIQDNSHERLSATSAALAPSPASESSPRRSGLEEVGKGTSESFDGQQLDYNQSLSVQLKFLTSSHGLTCQTHKEQRSGGTPATLSPALAKEGSREKIAERTSSNISRAWSSLPNDLSAPASGGSKERPSTTCGAADKDDDETHHIGKQAGSDDTCRNTTSGCGESSTSSTHSDGASSSRDEDPRESVTGFEAFAKEMYNNPVILILRPKSRLQAINSHWGRLTEAECRKWVAYAHEINKEQRKEKRYHWASSAESTKGGSSSVQRRNRQPGTPHDRRRVASKERPEHRRWAPSAGRSSSTPASSGTGLSLRESAGGYWRRQSSHRLERSMYNLFVKDAYMSADILKLPSELRMLVIAKAWQNLSAEERAGLAERLYTGEVVEDCYDSPEGEWGPHLMMPVPLDTPKQRQREATLSGYNFFVSECYTSPDLMALPYMERFAVIAREWMRFTPKEQKRWSTYAAERKQEGNGKPREKLSVSTPTQPIAQLPCAAPAEGSPALLAVGS